MARRSSTNSRTATSCAALERRRQVVSLGVRCGQCGRGGGSRRGRRSGGCGIVPGCWCRAGCRPTRHRAGNHHSTYALGPPPAGPRLGCPVHAARAAIERARGRAPRGGRAREPGPQHPRRRGALSRTADRPPPPAPRLNPQPAALDVVRRGLGTTVLVPVGNPRSFGPLATIALRATSQLPAIAGRYGANPFLSASSVAEAASRHRCTANRGRTPVRARWSALVTGVRGARWRPESRCRQPGATPARP